jgi:hypothetical protein
MATTYEFIASNTLASTAQSVTFSSIPQTYTDLVVRVNARTNDTGQYIAVQFRFNGDSANNYSSVSIPIYSTTTQSARLLNESYGRAQYGATASGATTNAFGNAEIYIPSYTVAAQKPIAARGIAASNNASLFQSIDANLWNNTAAITSITIFGNPTSYLWSVGSSFYLYGIKNS